MLGVCLENYLTAVYICLYYERMDDADIKALTEKLEYLFLKQIIASLRAKQMTVEESRAHARAFLQIEPFASIDDAHDKMRAFVVEHPSFAVLQEYMDVYYEEKHTEEIIAQMRSHLRQFDVDAALHVAQQNT